MHVRMNMLAGDPARLGEATRYLEGTVRPDVEAQHGNRGLACLTNADLGVCIVASYWDTLDAMTASEQAVQVSRKEVTGLLGGTVTVEHYEVPVFVRRSRPHGGAGVRLSRVDCAPASIDAVIEEFRNTAVPALTAMPGLCSAHMMTDRATGRCIVITAWDDMDALAASQATARLRADVAAVTHLQVRSVEEHQLVFSSVRDGDTRSLIERNIELWNARDRDGWMAGMDLHRLELQAPGGMRLAGREAATRSGVPGTRPSRITGWRSSPSTPTTGAACTRAASPARTPARSAGRRGRRDRPDGRRAFQRHLRIRGRQDHQLPPVLRPGGTAHSARHRRRQHVICRPAGGAGTPHGGVPAPPGAAGAGTRAGAAVGPADRSSAARYRELAPDVWPRPSPRQVVVMRGYLVIANQTRQRAGPADELRKRIEAGPSSFYLLVPDTRAADYPDVAAAAGVLQPCMTW